jgi:RNA polymerase sigma factor (sigma-70 family)
MDQVIVDNPPPEKSKWELTRESFEKFLSALHPDCEHAEVEYERLRLKLVKLFEWERTYEWSHFPDDCVDETFNRVCRKLSEGEVIENVRNYCYGVARNLVRELRKGPDRKKVDLEEYEQVFDWLKQYEHEVEEEHLDKYYWQCLQELDTEKRALIVEYYEGEKREKIERRELLANRLGINLDALRTRARRIRDEIRDCVNLSLGGEKMNRN